MILCVQSPRTHLPTRAPSTALPLGMRPGAVSPPHCAQSPPLICDPTKDLRAIASNFCHLENSGWYWGAITAAQAHAALQEASEGAFLVRDSSHPQYMLTLSVRTARGPTSIRIQYSQAQFLLDSSPPARLGMLSFPDVPSLVEHYMGPGRKVREEKAEDTGSSCKAAQQQQLPPPPPPPKQPSANEASVVLKLRTAVYKSQGFPSLQHLTRLTINRHSDQPERLPLPRPLLGFIKDYPFKV
ncbi:cytokine-inducible SH2-containing protein [Gadus chalcogrammus]|uniref:cytokine-inducible SH2-containing protein n=1 Tax=Gadus chalcogrammus TaxID=1042646 RepID=UPI0024C49FFB|nr:cytokine-inducible SH2-containing protein [Gadus chalcogrammus]